ncbi:hypothetical protein [Legionella clemsonensis]|uniref:Uncharacterized protein n=1 Tax=Legionella clemsonensis TaxID=1867846 RepID=A0A222NYA4_9GAMM|nr:hypothetical protein [Legionella clemsonensis]ASQ44574.1 hypothetical protein clem_00035 [Legionella clemsonensis]
MHCDIKKFQYSGNQVSGIGSVDITASIYGTTMTLNFPLGKKTDIVKSLSEAEIPLKSVGFTSISIRTPLQETANIKKTLEVLARDGFISQDFAQEIATNYPNGYGGKMDLNNPFKSKSTNALLMLAAPSILNLNAPLEKEARKDKQENTYCGFKPEFLTGKFF